MPCASSRSSATARPSSASASSRRAASRRSSSLPSCDAQESQREREPDEALLGAVVEIALEPAALGVARLDDAGPRRAQILELSPRLGLQALVLEREARRRRDLLDELGVVEEVGSVEDHRDGPALADERRRGATVQHERASTGRPRASA